MTTFRTGDRVRTVTETWGDQYVPVGAVGTVVRVGPFINVTFDHDPQGDGTGGWAIMTTQLQHLADTPTSQQHLRNTDGHTMLTLYALAGYSTDHQELV